MKETKIQRDKKIKRQLEMTDTEGQMARHKNHKMGKKFLI